MVMKEGTSEQKLIPSQENRGIEAYSKGSDVYPPHFPEERQDIHYLEKRRNGGGVCWQKVIYFQ